MAEGTIPAPAPAAPKPQVKQPAPATAKTTTPAPAAKTSTAAPASTSANKTQTEGNTPAVPPKASSLAAELPKRDTPEAVSARNNFQVGQARASSDSVSAKPTPSKSSSGSPAPSEGSVPTQKATPFKNSSPAAQAIAPPKASGVSSGESKRTDDPDTVASKLIDGDDDATIKLAPGAFSQKPIPLNGSKNEIMLNLARYREGGTYVPTDLKVSGGRSNPTITFTDNNNVQSTVSFSGYAGNSISIAPPESPNLEGAWQVQPFKFTYGGVLGFRSWKQTQEGAILGALPAR